MDFIGQRKTGREVLWSSDRATGGTVVKRRATVRTFDGHQPARCWHCKQWRRPNYLHARSSARVCVTTIRQSKLGCSPGHHLPTTFAYDRLRPAQCKGVSSHRICCEQWIARRRNLRTCLWGPSQLETLLN